MKPFEVLNAEPNLPIVANIPHSSAVVPIECREALVLSDAELAAEHGAIVDWFTDELYSPVVEAGGAAVVSRVSRLIVDTERFDDDTREPMVERGMGVIYEQTTAQRILRAAPSGAERERLLDSFYHPYHAALTRLCRDAIDRFGWCLLLDCHSFPAQSLPYERDRSLSRPQMCLGTDPRHSPEPLVTLLEAVTASFGWSYARNTPFAGTVVPLPLYGDRRIFSVMIEFNRALYMDEATTTRTEGLAIAQQWIRVVLEQIMELNLSQRCGDASGR